MLDDENGRRGGGLAEAGDVDPSVAGDDLPEVAEIVDEDGGPFFLVRFRKGLVVLQPVGEHAKPQGLSAEEGSFPRRTVAHRPGEIRDVGDPVAMDVSFQLEHQAHGQRIPLT